jgi:hypothetical protein
MRNAGRFLPFVVLVSLSASPAPNLAQSRLDHLTPAVPEKQEARAQAPTDAERLEKARLITAYGFDAFIRSLNDNGQLGYRLDKSLSYGGEGATQTFAAVLQLDEGSKYEYDWLSSPDKKLLEGRLNAQAKKGFNFVNAYALTYCSGGSPEDEANPTSPASLIFRLKKGDAFLLERKNGSAEQSREYQVFMAKVRLGDSAQKTIQAAMDGVAPQGFRPVKILFTRQGLLDFNVLVLVERDLNGGDSPKVEYRFIKKSPGGLPKEVNALAAQGFRFMTGRRVGTIGMALMAKLASDAAVYTFIDEDKYAKEFDKTVAAGNRYQAIMAGDLTCGSDNVENEKLVFAQNASGEKHEYKILGLSEIASGKFAADSSAEFYRLVGEGYRVKDLFYSGGVKVILEK